MTEMKLTELLERARAGDAEARERLFERCRKYVGVVARAQVQSWLQAKVDASDLVQQTMLELHRGMGDFQGQTEEEWLAWVRRVLTHNAVDYVRHYHGTAKRQIGREMSLDVSSRDGSQAKKFEPADGEASPSACVIQREDELRMAEALEELPPDYQDVITFRNLQRLPFDEVAQRMGRSRPAAQMLWMRAIQRLKDVMKSQES